MAESAKMSEEEFALMVTLLNRYVTTEMDQWELWSFDTEFSKIYVQISMKPNGPEDAYTSVNQYLRKIDS